MTFEESVFTHEFKLNNTDNSIIDYIKKNKNRLGGLSIHKMASELFISPNAIMRTAKKLGYSGFSELKFALQSESTTERNHNIHEHAIEQIPMCILKTLDVINENMLDKLIDEIVLLNNILIVGNNAYAFFCSQICLSIKSANKNAYHFNSSEQALFTSRKLNSNDLIIICDSETSKTAIDIAIYAKQNNIPCFCITHSGEHTISQICKYNLYYWCESKTVNKYDMTDRTGLLILIRKICERYWFKTTHK